MGTTGPGMNGDAVFMLGKKIVICSKPGGYLHPQSLWRGGSPLLAPTPLFLFQISLISIVSHLIDACLRPLWQSSIVSQIFSGLVFGPSLLGREKGISEMFFPLKGIVVLRTFASFGLVFFLFLIGVKTDVKMMMRPGRKAMIIGSSALTVTLITTLGVAFTLKNTVAMDPKLASSLPMLAASQGITGFPVIACLLTELKILNTDMGRLGLSAAMFSDFIGISIGAVTLSVFNPKGQVSVMSLVAISSVIALFVTVIFVFKPLVLIIRQRIIKEKIEDERYILVVFLMLLLTSFLSEIIGQHFILGSILIGVVVPEGPPLGTAIATKLDSLAKGLLCPTYCAMSGLATNVCSITLHNFWIVSVIVASGFFAKIVAVMLPAACFKVPVKDSVVLGLILNARGIIELLVFNMWKDGGVFGEEEFALAVTSMLLVSAIVTPLIKLLYDPSKQLTKLGRSTIQRNAENGPELRMLVCIHKQETVLSILNLLHVSHASGQSPLAIIAMVLVELLGRATPLLITHEDVKSMNQSNSMSIGTTSSKVIAAFNRYYEKCNEEEVSLKSFTSVSFFESMHEDICRVAADEQANIVILPFHKQFELNGSVLSVCRQTQAMNIRVLEKAPCSVGILIDRRISNGPITVPGNQAPSILRIGVIFIGGPDDAESLAYGARMVRRENVKVTVIRYLLFGSENSKERKIETNMIEEYRQMNAGNERFMCVEEVVKDGEGLASSIRAISDCFDIILVGRCHVDSPLTVGLKEWSECPELGVIGDLLASSDYGFTATILVVQQQRLGGNWPPAYRKSASRKKESHAGCGDNVSHGESGRQLQRQNSSWAIAVDR